MSRKILEMRAISRPRACPQYRGDNSCWRDLMTVSPAPLCCLSYFILNRTNYKFPAHFLEFSWYLKYIFVLYLNNRLKLSQSGQFLIIWRHREREQDKHYVKQIYISNCLYLTVFLALLLMHDYIYISILLSVWCIEWGSSSAGMLIAPVKETSSVTVIV